MFEIHLTTTTDNIDKFKKDCRSIGVKPLLIELYGKYDTYQQVMTSSVYKHDNIDIEVDCIVKEFKLKGYKIKRIKVEINPNNYNGDKGIKYLESHLRIIVNQDSEKVLNSLCLENGFHKSKNAFKIIDDGNYYI